MVKKAGHVVHLLGEDSPARLAGVCGATKGKGWRGVQGHVSWLYDRWCAKCLKATEQRATGLQLFGEGV